MADQIGISGLDETLRALRALPRAISGAKGGPLRKALFAGTKVIREAVREAAPVRTGNLKKNIVAVRDRRPGDVGAAEHYIVTFRSKRKKHANTNLNRRLRRAGSVYAVWGSAYYGKFLEFGTAKMPAHPFMRPAFEAKKGEAVQAFIDALRAEVGKAVEAAKRGSV